ncbi:MAG TPA: PepSY-like domain-containing protein [Bacteroidia bacterium]|nr:PepSY-like domain-containing protein [Bacteroidia bacterium]
MKKLILIVAIALTGTLAHAQKISSSEVPGAVSSKFSSMYPNSTVDHWKKEKGNYEVKFMQGGKKMCVAIDPSGNVVKTSTTISASELPSSVNDYVAKNYSNQKITEAEKISEADGTTKYEAKVNGTHLCFDSNGNFVKSEKRKS